MNFETEMLERRDMLMSFAMRSLRNRDDALDAVQETFLRALTHRDSFEPGTNLSAWLVTIMKNHLRGQYRTASRIVFTDDVTYADSLPSPDSPHAALEAKEDMEAISAMPSSTQCLLWMRGVGSSYREIARDFRVCENTAKTLIRRARTDLCALTGRARVNLRTGEALSPLSR